MSSEPTVAGGKPRRKLRTLRPEDRATMQASYDDIRNNVGIVIELPRKG